MSIGSNQIAIQQDFSLKVSFVVSLKSLPILLKRLTFFQPFYKVILSTHQSLVDGQLLLLIASVFLLSHIFVLPIFAQIA